MGFTSIKAFLKEMKIASIKTLKKIRKSKKVLTSIQYLEENSEHILTLYDIISKTKQATCDTSSQIEEIHNFFTDKKQDELEKDFSLCIKRLEKLSKKTKELEILYSKWLIGRVNTINSLEEIITSIKKVNKDTKIARGVGAGVSLIGGGAMFVGLCFFGPLTIAAGTVAAITGGITNTVSSVVDSKNQENKTTEATNLIKNDQNITADLLKLLNYIEKEISEIYETFTEKRNELITEYAKLDKVFDGLDLGFLFVEIGVCAWSICKSSMKTTFEAGKAFMRVLGPALVGVGCLLDIVEVISTLTEPAVPESANKLKVFVDNLEKQKDGLVKYHNAAPTPAKNTI